MSKVLTFSRTFPAYHPKAGQPTWFVEKIWKYIYHTPMFDELVSYESKYTEQFGIAYRPEENVHFHSPKNHTIRAGNRWKVGDKFSPRVWSGKPYRSKMITIATDIEVKKVWEIEIWRECENYFIGIPWPENKLLTTKNKKRGLIGTWDLLSLAEVANNDGLELNDLLTWFKPNLPFKGQIICWNENINY